MDLITLITLCFFLSGYVFVLTNGELPSYNQTYIDESCVSAYVLNDSTRNVANITTTTPSTDGTTIVPGLWFTIGGEAGELIPANTKCMRTHQCGVYYPIFLFGRHPTREEGVILGTLCESHASSCTATSSYRCCDYGASEVEVAMCPNGNPMYRIRYDAEILSINTRICGATKQQDEASDYNHCPDMDDISAETADPCTSYMVYNSALRNVDRAGPATCSSIEEGNIGDKWIRMFPPAGIALPEKPPTTRYGSCSTDVPMWLMGDHPAYEEGTVKRIVGASYWSGSAAQNAVQVHVKLCSANGEMFYTYRIPTRITPKSGYCNFAYCSTFDEPANLKTAPNNKQLYSVQATVLYGSDKILCDETVRLPTPTLARCSNECLQRAECSGFRYDRYGGICYLRQLGDGQALSDSNHCWKT